MGNIKLQVGEDYLNEIGTIRSIIGYSIEDDLYIDGVNSLYREDGTAIFNSMSRGFIENPINGLNLITHLSKANKKPSDEDIEQGFKNNALNRPDKKWDDLDKKNWYYWKTAIEWYKQQTE